MEYLLENKNIIRTTTRMEALMDEYSRAKEVIVDRANREVTRGRKRWVK